MGSGSYNMASWKDASEILKNTIDAIKSISIIIIIAFLLSNVDKVEPYLK
jgi:hypothetical protein